MTPELKLAPRLTAEDVKDLAEAARVELPTPAKVFTPYTFREILNRPPKRWLIQNLIGFREPVMLCADSKTGKTFVALDLIAALIQGATFADQFPINAAANVIYATSEGRGGLSSRFRALNHKWEFTDDQLARFGIYEQVPNLFVHDATNTFTQFAEELSDHYGSDFLTGGLLVIDTWARATAGADENTAKDTNVILQNVDHLINLLGCTVLVIHHTNRQGEMRGSSNIKAGFDNVIDLKKLSNGKRAMSCSISKDAADIPDIGFELTGFDFEFGGEWHRTAYVEWTGNIDPSYKAQEAKQANSNKPRILEALEIHANGYDSAITAPRLTELLGNIPTEPTVRKALNALVGESGSVKTRQETIKEKGTGKPNGKGNVYWFQQDGQ